MRAASILLIGAVLCGCGDSQPCQISFRNGQEVRDRLSGDIYIVTVGDPFTNISTGSCSIMVASKDRGYIPVSSYTVEPVPGRAILDQERGDG